MFIKHFKYKLLLVNNFDFQQNINLGVLLDCVIISKDVGTKASGPVKAQILRNYFVGF